MSEPILAISNLVKEFGSKNHRIQAVNNVSIHLPGNTVAGLLGNNGAGKTTLIKCVVGLLKPDHGEIFFGTKDIVRDATARLNHISVVLDGGRNLINYMTVKENLSYFRMICAKKNVDSAYINDISERMGIKDLYHKRIQELSFGMRQRVSIAIALASKTPVLFMDEPTNGLDISFQSSLVDLTAMLRKEFGVTTVISSHDMRFIEKTCDYCILMEKGQIIQSGVINDFLNHFATFDYTLNLVSPLSGGQKNLSNQT